ncbi:MAG: aminotransferase class I/II-fold pyridoxal phosphate-dependent enzyme [Rhodospirillales bacterium]|nr:aminotransferase class I/II-fold pyridoxal phosphate-dependent enzyme [Rhodospirillales bacterium]
MKQIPSPREFERIQALPPYVFAEVNAMKDAARAAGEDVIDLGMGNPDLAPPDHVVEKLIETVRNPRVHRYSASRGIRGLRRAVAGYYQRRFDVTLDPEREVIVALGSKEGFAHLATAITEPGDLVLVPDPSYPIHPYGFVLAGAGIRGVPVGPGRNFVTELAKALEAGAGRVKAVTVNFPANPTATVVGLEVLEAIVDLCRRHEVWILSDLAYAEIYFDDPPPPSILQVPGAKELAVEFTSLSKTYSMPGWRIGFAAGNPHLVATLTRIKSYLDYGAFTPIQVAATAALNGPQEYVDSVRAIYRRRRDTLVGGLQRAGWDVDPPVATMFVWARLPTAFQGAGSLAFAKELLAEARVAVSPGAGFGLGGEGWVRISLVENEQRIRQACRNIRQFLDRSDVGVRTARGAA